MSRSKNSNILEHGKRSAKGRERRGDGHFHGKPSKMKKTSHKVSLLHHDGCMNSFDEHNDADVEDQESVSVFDIPNEKGFTKFAHPFFDAVISKRLSGCEWAIVLLLLRNSVGMQKEESYASLRYIAEETKWSRSEVIRALRCLKERKLVKQTREARGHKAPFYALILPADEQG